MNEAQASPMFDAANYRDPLWFGKHLLMPDDEVEIVGKWTVSDTFYLFLRCTGAQKQCQIVGYLSEQDSVMIIVTGPAHENEVYTSYHMLVVSLPDRLRLARADQILESFAHCNWNTDPVRMERSFGRFPPWAEVNCMQSPSSDSP